MWQTDKMTSSPSSSLDSLSSTNYSSAGSNYDEALTTAREGTKLNPYVINMDLEFSEKNYPFDIIYVPRIEHGGWAREGIDIRMAIGVGDSECWGAWMDDSIPELQDHCIMVRGCSRSSDYDALGSYHRDNDESDTAAVHYKQKEDILCDPTHQVIYWRLITPKEMPLDNVILSSDSKQILKKEKGVKRTVGVDQDIVVLSYFVNWVIAKKKTGHQISSSRKTDLKDAFA